MDENVVSSKLFGLGLDKERYETEYKINEGILDRVIETHIGELDIDTEDTSFFPYIRYRIKDILVSVTDDLCRYAQYHNICTDMRAASGKECYSISESVRASFFTKWILKLRPCVLDYIAESGEYRSSNVDSHDAAQEFRDDPYKAVTFCNEFIAMISLAVILNVEAGEGEINSYHDLFSNVDMSTVFYALRYRVVHQDSYTLLFAKIASSLEEEV